MTSANTTAATKTSAQRGLWALAALALTALAFFFGTGLRPLWLLTWLAPLPVLWIAPRLRAWPAWGVSFCAFALSGLNMVSYFGLVSVPVPVRVLAIAAPALAFACFVAVHRNLVLRGHLLRAAFSLPVLWCAYEFLTELRSPHSTWGNLAYTQMACLPILQIVSITGIWAVSFLVFLLPSAAAAWFSPAASSRHTRAHRARLVATIAAVYLAVLGYGLARLHTTPLEPRVTVGLIASDLRQNLSPRGAATVRLVAAYAEQIPALASQGAKVIVIPEKLGHIDSDDLETADAILAQTARATHVFILAGFQHLPNLNEARLYSPQGKLVATYEKHHMLPAFESDLLPGTTRTLLDQPSGRCGIEICKDMDFPHLSTQYADDGAGLLLVPAWDFVTDGWLHGRMAILRGVESGFSLARAPKQGILTVSDDRGHVLAERNTGAAPFATLVASVPVAAQRTVYDVTGNWFPLFDVPVALVLLFSLLFVPPDPDPRTTQ
ncbi:MAG TPA: nitrilase-related carbon-nitrogen hydrolase [Acidobacteriaceae bacterium]|jgi:apolipoprotein N-acyltransferase|nr:nitrilase-related carbon-nitrogen hydrolase [Acidobacteriaceae bacterium]